MLTDAVVERVVIAPLVGGLCGVTTKDVVAGCVVVSRAVVVDKRSNVTFLAQISTPALTLYIFPSSVNKHEPLFQ